jgi:zinc transport system ATP-binding protein
MSDKKILNIQNLNYIKGDFKIIDNVNMHIDQGNIIYLIGPNGAGKTSLVKLIIGSLKPTSGVIKKCPNLKIGYVPQNLNLSCFLTITAKNFIKLDGVVIDDKIIEILKLNNLLNKYLTDLSGGELQKILLARSLMLKPSLLILDEADQNLDVAGQEDFFRIINEIHKVYKISMLVISHNLHLVMAEADRVYCLYHHICCSGSAAKLTKDPKFSELFSNYIHSHNK